MEEYFILKNIIGQGIELGYRSKLLNGKFSSIELSEGKWILSDGTDLGSTWDIILSPSFAEVFWTSKNLDYKEKLQEMVVMTSQDKIEFLKNYMVQEKEQTSTPEEEAYEEPVDALMRMIRKSLFKLKEYSEGTYRDNCDNNYKRLKKIFDKNSITELDMSDFIALNVSHGAMGEGFISYLNENHKSHYHKCPDCTMDNFKHDENCFVKAKVEDWLIEQNDGC